MIKDITKDILIMAYGITMVIFFLNIAWFGQATWTETGWILNSEIITFVFITGLGLYWFIKEIK